MKEFRAWEYQSGEKLVRALRANSDAMRETTAADNAVDDFDPEARWVNLTRAATATLREYSTQSTRKSKFFV